MMRFDLSANQIRKKNQLLGITKAGKKLACNDSIAFSFHPLCILFDECSVRPKT